MGGGEGLPGDRRMTIYLVDMRSASRVACSQQVQGKLWNTSNKSDADLRTN